jgi:hypothetical protein
VAFSREFTDETHMVVNLDVSTRRSLMETQNQQVAVLEAPSAETEVPLLDAVDTAISAAYAALPVGSDQQNQNYRDR